MRAPVRHHAIPSPSPLTSADPGASCSAAMVGDWQLAAEIAARHPDDPGISRLRPRPRRRGQHRHPRAREAAARARPRQCRSPGRDAAAADRRFRRGGRLRDDRRRHQGGGGATAAHQSGRDLRRPGRRALPRRRRVRAVRVMVEKLDIYPEAESVGVMVERRQRRRLELTAPSRDRRATAQSPAASRRRRGRAGSARPALSAWSAPASEPGRRSLDRRARRPAPTSDLREMPDQHAAAERMEQRQPRQDFEIVLRRLAEADAGIDDDARRAECPPPRTPRSAPPATP